MYFGLDMQTIKSFPLQDNGLEEIRFFLAVAWAIKTGYEAITPEVPDWLLEKIDEAKQVERVKSHAELKRKLQLAESRRAATATPDEKRKKLDDEIAAIKAQLG